MVITLKTSFYGEHNFPSFKGEGGEDGVHTFTNLKDAKDFIDNQREDFISKSHNVGNREEPKGNIEQGELYQV